MKYWRIAEIGARGGRGKMTMLGFALLTPTYAGCPTAEPGDYLIYSHWPLKFAADNV
jgi:hypothetical protein